MAGHAHHRGTDRSGRTHARYLGSRESEQDSAEPRAQAAPVPSDVLVPDPSLISPAAPLPPELEPTPIRTGATYRLLTMRGLEPAEAGNLTAYLAGLHVHSTPWTVGQVNRVLFLRELYASEAWGGAERHSA